MRSERMQPIARHADQLQQQAVQIYVQAQQAVISAQQQLEQLLVYRQEYSQSRVGGHINVHQLKDYQLFLEKLNQSIDQAYLVIQQKQQQCEKQRLLWLKKRSRTKALDAVIEKYQQQEAILTERIEQKEQDEFASRQAARKLMPK